MILVTGAGGSNGSELTKQLSAKGVSVRAMVRKSSPLESDALPGVEFVTADFDDLASVNRALEGVQSAFLVTNSSDRTETQQLRFVEAARAASVRHIVYLSQIHARKDSPVRFLRYHAVVEEAIAASGMTFTILRPNLYMQGLLGFRASIISEGRFFAPAGDSRVSIEEYGRLDCAFNNAGTIALSPVTHATEAHFRTVTDTNVKGIFSCLKYEIPAPEPRLPWTAG